MSLINDILGLSGANRANNSDGVRKGNNAKNIKEDKKHQVVKTEISSEARHLLELRSEANQYVDKVKQAETITPEEIDQIKERISSQYYFDSYVVDQIVERMIRSVKTNRIK